MLAGAVLVAAAAVAAAWLALDTGGSLVAEANSVAAIDPATHEIVATIPVGDAPTAIAASDDWVWVVNSNDGVGTISRLDARTSRPVSTFSVLGTPSDLLFAAGSLWVGTSEGRVSRIEPSSDVEEERWTLRNAGRRSAFVDDPGAGFLAYGAGTVWASTLQTLTRIAPATSQTTPLTSPGRDDFDVGLGSVWIGGTSGLLRLAARTLRRQAMVPLPFAVTDASVGAGSVWLPDAEGRRVWRVDAATNVVVRTYDLGGRGSSVAVGAGAVWAASDDGTVLRIDPATGAAESIHVGGAPIAVAVGADRVWVSVG
jgi:YVTN family beta-propeller protein